MDPDAVAAVVARYRRFAEVEAPGRSALYAEWARGLIGDPAAVAVLARIPAARRQPPLVFAVTRMLGAPERGYAHWAAWLADHADLVVEECARRALQTNEPARCAALLPALGAIDGPIALIELGASAGLCLYPDRYSYAYRAGEATVAVDPADGPSRVRLACDVSGPMPAPRMPQIVWRAGIDLQPLDAADSDDRRFLTSLVWPGEEGREARIGAALDVVAADPPVLVAGDATDPAVLAAVAHAAPEDARLVITTPGVLPHVPRAGRERLEAALDDLDATWITIDPIALHDDWRGADGVPDDAFVLGLDRRVLARVDPLGASVEWLPGAPSARG
ncbi:DUF2332 family protein [Microbacterium fluvii]|uniref:DUF2332 family protein n=1 Tax=Microbacterium fluvii TaxID=415215 RepID=A0ABW2HBB3_9MICO|nr:DUF2332 domain-containing protein [Microbacterium fluvii]MCU4671769.1 DUF2332 domain-containing protein [Microbacterium fluvii]